MAGDEASVHDRLKVWLDELMGRLAPDRIRIPATGTLEDATAMVLAEEELRVRASAENDLRGPKLEAINGLRRKLLGGGVSVPPPTGQAVYELVMGGLETVPLARLADLMSLWGQLVNGMGAKADLNDAELAELRAVGVTLQEQEGQTELVAAFRGTSEMVRQFRAYLRDAGIDQDEQA